MIRVVAIPIHKSQLVDKDVVASMPAPEYANEDGSRSDTPSFAEGGYAASGTANPGPAAIQGYHNPQSTESIPDGSARRQTSGSPSSALNTGRQLPHLASPRPRDREAAATASTTVALRVEVIDTGTGESVLSSHNVFIPHWGAGISPSLSELGVSLTFIPIVLFPFCCLATGLNGRDPESLFMEFTSHLG